MSARGDLPPIRIVRCDPARREPGGVLINVRRDPRPGERSEVGGWLVRIDRTGDLTCIHKFDKPVHGLRRLPGGNLLVTIVDGLMLEITMAGNILRQWYATGQYRDRAAPKEAVRVETETFHHGVNLGPDGNMLLLGIEVREYDEWPGSASGPNAACGRERVVGTIVMEVRHDGTKVNEWRLLDLLDPYRILTGNRLNYWAKRGYPGTNDWCHANATAYDAKDDSILVSLRNQNCIVKFDRCSGALRWILGSPENWRAPWSYNVLKPDNSVAPLLHQRDCSITSAGTIMCFGNGKHRALPLAPAAHPMQNHSRAVEFAVDEAARTVRQVWSYGDGLGEQLFAGFQGGAYRLPATGNTLITYGAICSIAGEPANEPDRADVRAQLIEVTPDKEVVFDLRIGGGPEDPKALSVFRSEFVPHNAMTA